MTEVNETPEGASRGGEGAGAEPLLKLRGIDKHFGPVQALYGVNLDLYSGQVTGLCGDNGAGKSVLTRSIAGVHQPDHGQIYFEGRPVHIRSARDASALGIETVYQDLALADNLDIVQNMFLGRERLSYGLLDEDSMELQAAETLSTLRVTTVRSIRQPVASLSGGQRQSVAVAKAVMWNSKLVLLDEPTAALGVVQTKGVLDLIRRVRDRGLGVVFISHSMPHVIQVADEVQVMRLGKRVATYKAKETTMEELVGAMTGAVTQANES